MRGEELALTPTPSPSGRGVCSHRPLPEGEGRAVTPRRAGASGPNGVRASSSAGFYFLVPGASGAGVSRQEVGYG